MVTKLAGIPTSELLLEIARRGEILPVKIIEPPPVTPILSLEQIYQAIRIDDPEADAAFILEGILSPGQELWIGPISLAPRVCVQRLFILWGDTVVKVGFGIDTQDRFIGPFFLPPNATTFEFIKYWVKRTVYIYLKNTDTAHSAEYHIIASAVMPMERDWIEYWEPRLKKQVKALKG